MNTSFFGELLQSLSERGRSLLKQARRVREGGGSARDIVELCEEMLSTRGEASGVALAHEILTLYAGLSRDERLKFFDALARGFGPDRSKLHAAVSVWSATPNDRAASGLHLAAEPRRMELFRRLNLAPGGTAALVAMREQLMESLRQRPDLAAVDTDFVHLLSSWFNPGFLVLRRIDWSTPANILEKIIRHEAVHEIASWEDLRRRIDPSDRHCYAFFHPALADDPLVFVEVALVSGLTRTIAPILADKRQPVEIGKATTAIFYSISNCQKGLAGVSFGNFLIKQVVENISKHLPRLSAFATLSPVPNFAEWLRRERQAESSRWLVEEHRAALQPLDIEKWWETPQTRNGLEGPLRQAAALYLLHARNPSGFPLDPVARFHLRNGARLEQINFLADLSEKGLRQSHGVMVNYLYDPDDIEKNHDAFVTGRVIAASEAVKRIVGDGRPGELMKVAS